MSKKIHVLYVITKLELGGAQKVCLSLHEGALTQGYVSHVVTGREGVLVTEAQRIGNVIFLKTLKREINSFFGEIRAFFSLFRTMRKLKKQYKNIIVHTHSTKAGLLGRWAAFFAGIKTRVHTVHGFGFHEFQSRFMWLIVFFLEYVTSLITTHFVCVSETDRFIGIRYFPKFLKKSSVIRAAIDWKRFIGAQKSTTGRLTIGTVSCFKPQKNLLDLLQAFKIVFDQVDSSKKEILLLQIIGDGLMRPVLEQWVNDNGLTAHVEFLGWQSHVVSFMKTWDIFALSSLWEGLPCAIIEARVCKLPVVAYNVGGIHEVINDGVNGFLIPAGNIHLLAQKLVYLINQPNVRDVIGNHGDALHDFSDKVMVTKHLELYKSLTKF